MGEIPYAEQEYTAFPHPATYNHTINQQHCQYKQQEPLAATIPFHALEVLESASES